MAGVIPIDGKILFGNYLFKGADANRGTNLQLGLLTNSTMSVSKVLADIVEPTGGGYARKTLTDASWVNTSGVMTYAIQTFSVTTTDYNLPVYGYFLVSSNGSVPKLLAYEMDSNGPYTLVVGDQYDVTPTITMS